MSKEVKINFSKAFTSLQMYVCMYKYPLGGGGKIPPGVWYVSANYDSLNSNDCMGVGEGERVTCHSVNYIHIIMIPLMRAGKNLTGYFFLGQGLSKPSFFFFTKEQYNNTYST